MPSAALGRGAFARFAVTGERFPFALHARKFGARFGEGGCGAVAAGLQLGFPRLHLLERAAPVGQRPGGFLGCSLGGIDIGVGILARQRRAAFGHPAPFRRSTVEPGSDLRDFRFSDAPFGFHPGIVGSRACQREFGGAAVALGLFMRAFECGPLFFIARQRLFARGQLAFEPRQSFGGILGQPVGFAAVGLEPRLLPVEIGEPLLRRFELAAQRRHAVAMRAGIVAAIGLFVARFGQRLGGTALRLLRRIGLLLRFGHARIGLRGGGLRFLRRRSGFAPARKHQPRLGALYLVR